ncbi:polysaccharide lyase 6 family protein [Salinimonas marina]|uniref:Polysaccharide lyase 6 family protein n=1 Tax=Salinimonas marina TaxID=2785918 RepID=A0A7S9DW73_9ALTE|nr:polysaccharide lyase 6 family protein [Salinimonas marina]QPG05018.1 polysaccharide lyase 6 family protein [Salinimonas marina]
MILLKKRTSIGFFLLLGLFSHASSAKNYLVEDKKDYSNIAQRLTAGDTVTLKNGTWKDFEIVFSGQGNAGNPIRLKAQTPGKVVISGLSNLQLSGEYLQVSGLIFKDGYTPSSSVITFRHQDKEANHSRVSNVVIDNFNNPDKQESDYWVALYGKRNRLDHSHFVGKRNKGVTVAVRLTDEKSQQNYHRIDHNYFGYRPVFGSNGGETLRIGTSHYSLTDSFTKVDHNYFDKTNGEVEIISVKSGKNELRNNVFNEARGTLTLRHGNGNIVDGNVFFGNGQDHTGGIRVINKDQIVRNNYLENLTGYRFGSGLTIMNGVKNSPINRYHQVENALIENNSFINVRHIQLAAGSDAERTAVPTDTLIKNNLIVNDGRQPFTLFDDISGITFKDNVSNQPVLSELRPGVAKQNISLSRHKNGLLYPTTHSENVGVQRDLIVVSKDETGVQWYPKAPATTEFDSGATHRVAPTPQALYKAIEAARSGDTIVLSAGQYDISRLLKIDKVLTISAHKKGQSKLTFARSALFEIHDGGSLKLDGLALSGKNSPDAAANSVVRTAKWGMLENYRFIMKNSSVADLDINHSFDFFVSGKGALADQLALENNTFENITGDILRLDREIEDLGIYNAEYVVVNNNQFKDVQGTIASIYRGGTDESTFGPHLEFAGNTLTAAGKGKRNKTDASLYLHGVQVSKVTDNQFSHSAPLVIEHTVGEPQTAIKNNRFEATAAPEIKELHAEGPHTATLQNNQVTSDKERQS